MSEGGPSIKTRHDSIDSYSCFSCSEGQVGTFGPGKGLAGSISCSTFQPTVATSYSAAQLVCGSSQLNVNKTFLYKQHFFMIYNSFHTTVCVCRGIRGSGCYDPDSSLTSKSKPFPNQPMQLYRSGPTNFSMPTTTATRPPPVAFKRRHESYEIIRQSSPPSALDHSHSPRPGTNTVNLK